MTLKGLAFPLSINSATGNLATAEGAELIGMHIKHFLLCQPGESPMRSPYGTPDTLFTTQSNYGAFAAEVQRRLTQEVPQAEFNVSASLREEGSAILQVFWAVDDEQDSLEIQITND